MTNATATTATTATATTATTTAAARYLPPARADLLFNRITRRFARMGLSMWGSRELRVVGRRSGEVRSTTVNVLELDGERYLVAARGNTEWVRNLRAAGHGELRVGRKVEAFRPEELEDDAKAAVLRPYLDRWAFEVGRFFDGVGADAGNEELAAIAPNHPVFRLLPA